MVAQQSLEPHPERPRAPVEPARLKAAVRNGELELRYQPEVDLLTGEIVALEGLIRWSCPGVGAVEPGDFLPIAQDLGLMPTIDSWVLETGAAQAAVWRSDYGQNRLLWLNVSMDSLLDEAFIYRIIGILDRHALPAGELGLEISERVLVRLGDDAEAQLSRLRQLGLALIVDDFSSYDSALDTIASLPVDGVKLGHRLVRGPASEAHEGHVRAIVERAHDKGIYVVAEGVETADEAARLARLGCDRAHGYLFASAQRPDRAAWMLEQGFAWRGHVVPQVAHSD
ncbi:MAG: diguanylate cyclase [Frankiales bacterium]|nr:diguanylate cyclase [Frankiales bacterium]